MKTSIAFVKGYWTIYSGSQPIITVDNLWEAIVAVGELEEGYHPAAAEEVAS